MIWGDFFAMVIAGVVCGFVDSSLGMGYGVTSASVLMTFSIAPAVVSASVHMAEAFVDAISAGAHLKFGNVQKNMLSPLLICGTIGAILGAAVLSFISLKGSKPFVASILLFMGVVILFKFLIQWKKNKKLKNDLNFKKASNYSKKKLALLGFVAGFIDASGGGGWGPILTPAFVATGSNPKKAVGTVEFTEPLISFATFMTFGIIIGFENFLWNIVLPMVAGGIILTPIAAYVCSKTPRRLLGILVGLWVAVLNVRTLILVFLAY